MEGYVLFASLTNLSAEYCVYFSIKEWLSGRGFVHRDLAARNALLRDAKTVKLSDFGLARFTGVRPPVGSRLSCDSADSAVSACYYINSTAVRLPARWMAIESLEQLSFSTASDV